MAKRQDKMPAAGSRCTANESAEVVYAAGTAHSLAKKSAKSMSDQAELSSFGRVSCNENTRSPEISSIASPYSLRSVAFGYGNPKDDSSDRKIVSGSRRTSETLRARLDK
ncbi:hypothetical protein EVAR_16064_1 [Eumeta japonica]|uniref:Uncharacterized protein n=1 Tax=Eumeta variegata TaxID=151549 RepID=A0A4C1UJZ2_EUMVA|nr:hypothetical protein EVAR_16064_1 [Eumeta japonica]